MTHPRRYHGKYRGVVASNLDPDRRGRIQAIVPDVTGDNLSTWALPCVPYAESGHGLLVLPQPGASVWIEYEYGDPDRPIWTGCFWDTSQVLPTAAGAIPPAARGLALETDSTRLTLAADRGADGGITLQTEGGATIQVHRQALVLTNAGAKITLDHAGVTVEHDGGSLALRVGAATLKVEAGGITLECGGSKLVVTAASIDVNHGALTVV